MTNLKIAKVNYKEICISEKFNGQYQVSVFDTERKSTSYRNYFKSLQQAQECFEELIKIQEEKMCYQF